MSGTTELSMEGVKGVGSELERVHIAEKNKAMAAKLKVWMFLRLNRVSTFSDYWLPACFNTQYNVIFSSFSLPSVVSD